MSTHNEEPVRFEVSAEYHDQRIDKFLATVLEETTRTQVQKQISRDAVLINDKPPVKGSRTQVKLGDSVSYIRPKPELIEIVAQDIPIEILYQDEDLLVVNKPINLVVHPAPGHPDGTLVNALAYHITDFEVPNEEIRPGIVHRLDKDTSGVMVVAKNQRTQTELVDLFQSRKVTKKYFAVIRGIPKYWEGTIESLYGRHPHDRKKFSSKVSQGKNAITHYEIIETYLGCSLVEIQLETGRTHQIRVHFHDHGHPLIGDPVYGAKRNSKDPRLAPILNSFTRPALHSHRLSFRHPKTHKKVSFESPIPEDMEVLIERLRDVTPES